MRLVCPKCAAQYEVDDDAIPAAGRDVQCSDCGHAWFHRVQDRIAVAPTHGTGPARSFPAPPPEAAPGLADPPAPAPPRKPLDEHVMAILREEALREAAARRADATRTNRPAPPRPGPAQDPAPAAGPVPPAAAVPGPPPTAQHPPAWAGASREDAPPAAPAVPPPVPAVTEAALRAAPLPAKPPSDRPTARRGLLPDIEETNSTLAAGSQRRGTPPMRDTGDRRPGFRAGFALMLLLILLAGGAYALAPRIATLVPQSSAAMTTYVGTVDHLRRQLDAVVTTARQRVDTLLRPDG